MTSTRPGPDTAKARLARRCIRMLRRHARGGDPESWAGRHLIPAFRRHAPPRPPVTVLYSGTLRFAVVAAAINVDKRSPEDVFAAMGLAVPDRVAAADPARPLHIRDLADFAAALELSPAAVEQAETMAEILNGNIRPPLWLRALIWARSLAVTLRQPGRRRRPAKTEPATSPDPVSSDLSALDKLAYRAMRPWADDDLSRAIVAKAMQLARRRVIDERTRLQAIAMADMGGRWHGAIGGGRWQVEDFVQCWRFAVVLVMRDRHSDWRQAPRFWRLRPWAASIDRQAADPLYSHARRAPPHGDLGGVRTCGQAARDGPLSPAAAGSLRRARRRFSRPPGPVYGPLAARIRAAAPAWEQSRAALDAIGALSSPRDAAMPRPWAGIVICHPHTGPPSLPTASGGHVMSP